MVKALDCGLKGPGFQSHLQQRFISLLGALSPTPKNNNNSKIIRIKKTNNNIQKKSFLVCPYTFKPSLPPLYL